jgi:predicted amidohydrolase
MGYKWHPPSGELRVCGLQARLFSRDAGENRQELLEMLEKLEPASCDLVITPEASNLYYHYEEMAKLHGGEEEDFIAPFRARARELKSHILLGSVMVRDSGKLYNRSHLLAPDGTTAGTYDKMHLIALFAEPQHFTPGRQLMTADIAGWKVGFAICFDLRFAEMFLNYALAGCHLIALPSCWPDTRIKPWLHLHLARAQETQCYFAGVNHGGVDDEGRAYRMSMVSAPDSEIVAQLPDAQPGVLRAVLSPDVLIGQKKLYDLPSGRGPFPMGKGTVLPDELA